MGDFQCFKAHLARGNVEGVRENLRGEFMHRIVDDLGQLPIHVACRDGFVDIARLLLDRNGEMESESIWGWRAIHWGSRRGHSEILKLLLQRKCRIDCRTKKGESPLDLAKRYNRADCVELLTHAEKLFPAIERDDAVAFDDLFKSSDFIMQNIYTGLAVLERAIESNADKIIKLILDKAIDDKEINNAIELLTAQMDKNENLMKECVLYLCITHGHMSVFKRFNSAHIINGQHRIGELSFLELAVNQGHHLFVESIMKKTVYDKSLWIKAIDKAKEKGFRDIQEEIQERMILMESRQKANFTILHTAISDNDADMTKFILDNQGIVDINTNNETMGTALALAHSLHHRKCIEVLQEFQIDTNN